ncbi:MAG: hypothetical protein AAF171_07755 [Cyanobacteria bacterium P01_A01_bin.116]
MRSRLNLHQDVGRANWPAFAEFKTVFENTDASGEPADVLTDLDITDLGLTDSGITDLGLTDLGITN